MRDANANAQNDENVIETAEPSAPNVVNTARRVANVNARSSKKKVKPTVREPSSPTGINSRVDRSADSLARRTNESNVIPKIVPVRVVLNRINTTYHLSSNVENRQRRLPSRRAERSAPKQSNVPMNFGRLSCIVCQKKLVSVESLPKMRSVVCSYECALKQI